MAYGVTQATRVRLQAAGICLAVIAASWLLSGLIFGVQAGLGAALSGLIILAFFGSGYFTEKVFLTITDMRGMGLTIFGYLIRMGLVWLVGSQLAVLITSDAIRTGIAIGAVAGIVGWLWALCYEQAHTRVLIYDEDYLRRRAA